ncbi:MAG: hypothetical protein NTV52_00420 [Acidobacteria bacterium]|nr:hypothetical protein [Acidobacteriota bacterium]
MQAKDYNMSTEPKYIELVHFDLEKLKNAEYSHAQALVVTGLSNDILQAWFKRGFLGSTDAEANREKLRGHRRRYSIIDMLRISVMSELSACGMSLTMAAITSTQLFVFLVQMWQLRLGHERVNLPFTTSIFFVVYEIDGEIKADLYSNFDLGEGASQRQPLEAFLSELGSTRISLIDANKLLTRFTHRLLSAKDLSK